MHKIHGSMAQPFWPENTYDEARDEETLEATFSDSIAPEYLTLS
jgi:hypothetical protein